MAAGFQPMDAGFLAIVKRAWGEGVFDLAQEVNRVDGFDEVAVNGKLPGADGRLGIRARRKDDDGQGWQTVADGFQEQEAIASRDVDF